MRHPNFKLLQALERKMLLTFQIGMTSVPFVLAIKKANIASFFFTFQNEICDFPPKKTHND